MRHQVSGRSFGRLSAQKKALFRGLATSLVTEEKITTTQAKAKELRRYIEPIITLAKRGDLHARRQVASKVYTKEVVQKLFAEIGPRYKERAGGYTRIYKMTTRHGDGAPMVMIELVDRPGTQEKKKAAPKKKTAAKKQTKKTDAAKAKPKKTAPKKTASSKTSTNKKATAKKTTARKSTTKAKKV